MKILVLNGNNYFNAVKGLGDPVYDAVDFMSYPEQYGLVMFTGGEDVHPSLYGETSPHNLCGSNINRDIQEQVVFEQAKKHSVKMTGICRGSQFLNVMNGGRMIHHLDGHAGQKHRMVTTKDDHQIWVNSTHHQMSIPSENGFVVGWAANKQSSRYFGDLDEIIDWPGPEVEVLLYPKTQCFAVQYHPEWLDYNTPAYEWYWNAINDFLDMDISKFTEIYTGNKKNAVGKINTYRAESA